MCQLKAPSFNKHVFYTHPVIGCHCITSRPFLCKFSIAFTETSKSCSKNDLFLRGCRIHCVFLQHMFSSNSNLVRAILLGLPEKLTSKLNYKKTPPHVPPEFLKKLNQNHLVQMCSNMLSNWAKLEFLLEASQFSRECFPWNIVGLTTRNVPILTAISHGCGSKLLAIIGKS